MKDRFFSLLGACGLLIALSACLPAPSAYGSGCSGPPPPPSCRGTGCVVEIVHDTVICAEHQPPGACTGAPECGCYLKAVGGCVCTKL